MGRLLAIGIVGLIMLAGCATTPPGAGISGIGVVQTIQETSETSTGANVVGAVGGAVLGAFLGSQIGGGSGQIIAATAGGVGGSMAGSAVASRAGAISVWIVNVRFEDGIDRAIRVTEMPTFRPGQRVRVESGVIRPI
jgi:outer membrane lipoprotein SlyB